jgi:hypothetical protein
MIELAGNVHIHTKYSDGSLYHAELAALAADAGLDFLLTTDHNILVQGVEGWRTFSAGRRVLLLVGEEIHHQDRKPQKNHLLAFGVRGDFSRLAPDPQAVIDAVHSGGGAAFLAHPFDPAAPLIGENSLSWVSWDAHGYAGLEIWNYMSGFKSLVRNPAAMIFFALFPSLGIRGPDPKAIAKWDELLAEGRRVAAIGGSDSHGHGYKLGPLHKTVFPYAYLFRAVNMHLLLDTVTGDADADGRAITSALRNGRGWVAYDLPLGTRGFRFWAEADQRWASMGEDIPLATGPILKASFPASAQWKILCPGKGTVHQGRGSNMEFAPIVPGAYRLEARRMFHGRTCGWIFTNPIYIL